MSSPGKNPNDVTFKKRPIIPTAPIMNEAIAFFSVINLKIMCFYFGINKTFDFSITSGHSFI